MKPLAVHGGAAAGLFAGCAVAWGLFELALAIRVRGGGGRDRSVLELTLAVLGGIALGQFAARRAQGLALPGPGWWPVALGVVVFVLGLGIRLGTWLSIPACRLPPLIAFTARLLTEEYVLSRELGEPYRAYMARTKRLIPGVW